MLTIQEFKKIRVQGNVQWHAEHKSGSFRRTRRTTEQCRQTAPGQERKAWVLSYSPKPRMRRTPFKAPDEALYSLSLPWVRHGDHAHLTDYTPTERLQECNLSLSVMYPPWVLSSAQLPGPLELFHLSSLLFGSNCGPETGPLLAMPHAHSQQLCTHMYLYSVFIIWEHFIHLLWFVSLNLHPSAYICPPHCILSLEEEHSFFYSPGHREPAMHSIVGT